MRVAAVQYKAIRGDKQLSLQSLRSLAAHAGALADLVVLPEMAATGYRFQGHEEVAAAAEEPRGSTFEALAPVARAHGCWIVVGFPERARDRYFNSALVLDPTGALRFTYRKTLLFEQDTRWASPGDSGYARLETDLGAFTVGICMDLNDDRFRQWCGTSGVQAVALPTNWIDEDLPVWPYWALRMEGVEAALVAANTYGAEGELRFCGRSAILSRGAVLAAAPASGDRVIRAEI